MSDEDETRSLAWHGPAIAWAILIVGVVVLTGFALSGGALGLRLAGALALSAAMLTTLAVGLMGFGREPALIRLTAVAAAIFIGLMTLLSFADLLTRYRG